MTKAINTVKCFGDCGSFQCAHNTARGPLTVCENTSSFGLNPVLYWVTSVASRANPTPSLCPTLYNKHAIGTWCLPFGDLMHPDFVHDKPKTDNAGYGAASTPTETWEEKYEPWSD